MDYPIWNLTMGGGVLIGFVSILHVIVSHFAVGGGIAIAILETLSVKRGDRSLRDLAKRSSLMLILVSTVFGAISGVGIWVTIGLVQPAATSALIHTFVWGWAAEWAFFVLEVVMALAYYATWEKVSKQTHLLLIWLYAFAAYMSLVIIQGIIAFMLTPGRWLETRSFMDGFFNPTYLPGLVYRTGICLLLAGAYLTFAAFREKDRAARARLMRFLAGFEVVGALVAFAGFCWWEMVLPVNVQSLFLGANPILASLAATRPLVLWGLAGVLLIGVIVLLLPRAQVVPLAVVSFLLAAGSFGGYERLREGARKPFIIRDYMFSNGILVSEIPGLNEKGVLSKAIWAAHDAGPTPTPEMTGRAVFRAQCAACHTLDHYLSIRKLTEPMDVDFATLFLDELKKDGSAYRDVGPGKPGPALAAVPSYPMMAPFVGTDAERDALAAYLVSLKGAPKVAASKESPDAH